MSSLSPRRTLLLHSLPYTNIPSTINQLSQLLQIHFSFLHWVLLYPDRMPITALITDPGRSALMYSKKGPAALMGRSYGASELAGLNFLAHTPSLVSALPRRRDSIGPFAQVGSLGNPTPATPPLSLPPLAPPLGQT